MTPAQSITAATELATADDWFSLERRVGWVDVDSSGAYQFTTAIRYAEECEIAMLRELGILDLLYPHLPRVSVHADFIRPCHFDDLVSVRVRVESLGSSSLTFGFRLELPGNVLCAAGRTSVVHLGPEGTPTRVPDQAREALSAYTAPRDTVGGSDGDV
ncbi:MAG: acyl-CoA thioesterase [Marmoricola sp.]